MATLTGNEKIAARNIRHCINWVVGGWYNCIQDDCPEYIPDTKDDAINEIYYCAMTNEYGPGYEGCNRAPREMRFAGTEFIMNRILNLLENDGDWSEIAEVKGW